MVKQIDPSLENVESVQCGRELEILSLWGRGGGTSNICAREVGATCLPPPPPPSALSTDGVFACVRFLGRGSTATPDTCQLKQSQIIQVFAVPFVLLSFLHKAGLTLKITSFSREDFQSHLTLVNLLTTSSFK